MNSNYSVDTLKKAAFLDEINNVLKVIKQEAPDCFDEKLCIVFEYLQKRIKQFEAQYKN